MKSTLLLTIRFGLGIVFLYSGAAKIRNPYEFLSAVYSYQIVGAQVGMVFAGVMPWFEAVTGGCLVGGVMLRGASIASMVIGATLTIATASALVRGLQITCGCFGEPGKTIDGLVVIRSFMVFMAGIATAYLAYDQRTVQKSWHFAEPPVPECHPLGIPQCAAGRSTATLLGRTAAANAATTDADRGEECSMSKRAQTFA